MFWKLALTIGVILLLTGRSDLLRHPIVRLLLPRSWAARLSLLPTRSSGSRMARDERPTSARSNHEPEVEPANPASPSSEASSWFGNRTYYFLLILAATAVVAWVVTRALIVQGTADVP